MPIQLDALRSLLKQANFASKVAGFAFPCLSVLAVIGVIAFIELMRRNGIMPPIPFLFLFASLVFSSVVGGFRASLVGAAIASGFIVYSAQISFGPSSLTGGPLQVTLGVAVSFLTAGSVGWIRDKRKRLIQSLSSLREELEIRVEERTRELQDKEERASALALENSVLAEISRIISSSLDFNKVSDRFVEQVKELLQFDRLSILILEEGRKSLAYLYQSGIELYPDANGKDQNRLSGLDLDLLLTQNAFVVQGDSLDEYFQGPNRKIFAIIEAAGIRSIIVAPLISDDNIIGVIGISSLTENAYSGDDRLLAERITHQIAGAVANSFLYQQRIKSEESLQHSEEMFRQLTENIREVFWLRDAETQELLYVSPAFEEIWGYSNEELKADPELLVDRVHPDDEGRLTEFRKKRYQDTDKNLFIEFRIIRSDGNIRWVSAGTFPILKEGHPFRIAGIAEDITERKQLEAQLIHAQKMEAVGRLAGGIAHDFNNLLSVILGYSSLGIAKLSPDSPAKDYIVEVQNAGERASNLTRQLLAFSRQQAVDPRIVNVDDLIVELTKLLRHLVGEDVELAILTGGVTSLVEIDPGQLEQVIINLAINARDAILEKGKIIIRTTSVELGEEDVSSYEDNEPGDYVIISVSDTGAGIPDDVREHIFEPFFTTKEVGKGTGLGLSTCFGIIKQAHGFIEVDTTLGDGTTFNIYLPCSTGKESESAHQKEQNPIPRSISQETILLVEDDESVRDIAKYVLENLGYNVLEAQNGVDALKLIGTHSPERIDLVLTDLIMPRMGGLEMVEILERKYPDIRVLYVSGYTHSADVLKDHIGGSHRFVQKPYTPSELGTSVRAVIDNVLA